MKKKLLSLLFVLVLMVAVIPSASADYSFKVGDPIEITVRGYELSIRKADAEMIEVL